MLLDQRDGFQAVFPLRDQVDLGKALQQEREFVARRPFVVDDHGVDSHDEFPEPV